MEAMLSLSGSIGDPVEKVAPLQIWSRVYHSWIRECEPGEFLGLPMMIVTEYADGRDGTEVEDFQQTQSFHSQKCN